MIRIEMLLLDSFKELASHLRIMNTHIEKIKKNNVNDEPWICGMQQRYKDIFVTHLVSHMKKDIELVQCKYAITSHMSNIYADLRTHDMSVLYNPLHPNYNDNLSYMRRSLSECNAMDAHTTDIFMKYANWCETLSIPNGGNYPFLEELHNMYLSLNEELLQTVHN